MLSGKHTAQVCAGGPCCPASTQHRLLLLGLAAAGLAVASHAEQAKHRPPMPAGCSCWASACY